MKFKIIPTVFAKNKKDFYLRFYKLIKISKEIQIDFMDGRFVSGKSIKVSDVPNLKEYRCSFEAHLMCNNPEKFVSALYKKGFEKIIVHYESVKKVEDIIKTAREIKKRKMYFFIAVNPESRISEIEPLLKIVDGVLLMGIHPGKEKQKFIPRVYEKIRELREYDKKMFIQVDGGVSFDNINKLSKLGVNAVNSGSLVAQSDNPLETIRKLSKLAKN